MKTVKITITETGFDLEPEYITIVQTEKFAIESEWPEDTSVEKIVLELKHVLVYDSDTKSYLPDDKATEDWETYRFGQRTLKPTSNRKVINGRTKASSVANSAHRLIKLKATLHYNNGWGPVEIDPIWDERHG